MSTPDLAGPAAQVQPKVEPFWGYCAFASVVLGVAGLLAAGLFGVVGLTFLMDGLPGAGILEDVAVLVALGAPVAGLVRPGHRTELGSSAASVRSWHEPAPILNEHLPVHESHLESGTRPRPSGQSGPLSG